MLRLLFILLILLSQLGYSFITIGVAPAKIVVNLTEKDCETIQFRFWNRGDEKAYFTIIFPKNLNYSCENCTNFEVNPSNYFHGYVTKNITFCRSPKGTYIISVVGRENKTYKSPIKIAAGIKVILDSPIEKTESKNESNFLNFVIPLVIITLIVCGYVAYHGWK